MGWGWSIWSGVVLVVYILSTGPIIMMIDKKIIRQSNVVIKVIDTIYRPIDWATETPVLAKPLIEYWHLWAPKLYDSNGKRH
jgi:hypothetical protein